MTKYLIQSSPTRKIEPPLAVVRLMQRFSFSSEMAEVIASLAGLGNQEASH